MKLRWIVPTVIGAFILFTLGDKRIDIALTCPLCLQSGDRVEKELFGIPYYHRQSLRRYPGGIDTPFGVGPRNGYVDPRLYQEIFGRPCTHVFKKGGFCRSTFALTGCGSYGEGTLFRMRNQATEETFRAYTRVKDKAIARKTFDLLENVQPVNSNVQPTAKLYFLSQNLALVTTTREWEQVLVGFAHEGEITGSVITDVSVLLQRLRSGDQRMQLAAVDSLAGLKTPEAWEVLATGLSHDGPVAAQAKDRIIWARYFPLYPRLLKKQASHVDIEKYPVWPFPYDLTVYDTRLSDDQLRELLRMADPYVDRYCLGLIWRDYRFNLLDDVMVNLNSRPSSAAVTAVNQLLFGPRILAWNYLPLYEVDHLAPEDRLRKDRDPWTALKNDTTTDNVGSMTGLPRRSRDIIQMQQEVIKFGIEKKPQNWEPIHERWEKWTGQRAVESTAAAFAQAMYGCDPKRTLEWLSAQFPGETGSHHFRTVLASMGAIADQSFLPALEAFSAGIPRDDRTQDWRPLLDYAIHRCKRIQDWKVIKDATGHYHIERPAQQSDENSD